jgi:uncharacterized protein YjaG (DUF416 family)
MDRDSLNSIDDYERFVAETIEPWTPAQRTALAASMAERWLPAYEAFSKAEKWGDAAALRRMLDSIWSHAAGRPLDSASRARFASQLHDSTPHMDDFDAEEALAAAVIFGEALKCCGTSDNLAFALGAAQSGFEAVAPDWAIDPDEQPRLWRKAAIRGELKKQLAVIEAVGALTRLDDDAIAALRRRLTSKELIGTVPRRREPTGPIALSNQALFERFRAVVESDIRTAPPPMDPSVGAHVLMIMNMSAWMGRYSRRRQILTGEYGPPADTLGIEALLAANRARDAAETRAPTWGLELQRALELTLGNPHARFDARSPEAPHGHGPSLRRLWIEATSHGESNDQAWERIIAWGRHRPESWALEDRRKKRGLADAPSLGERMARDVTWSASGDPRRPWTAQVGDERWHIGIGDFPDEHLYYLVVDDAVVGPFHDWPDRWTR